MVILPKLETRTHRLVGQREKKAGIHGQVQADDFGVGKTIKAGLIVRELMDRGEIRHLAVPCPPHLVEQWQNELESRFNLQTVALTSASASRIERDLPHGIGLFDCHPVVVVSLDYIKSERHRAHFLSTAPECVIVMAGAFHGA